MFGVLVTLLLLCRVKKLENLEGKDPTAIIDRIDRRRSLKSKVSSGLGCIV